MTLYVTQQKRHGYKEQTFGLCGRRQRCDDLREQHWNMYITICNLQFKLEAWNRALKASTLRQPRGMGWGMRWKGGSGWGTHVHPWLTHVSSVQFSHSVMSDSLWPHELQHARPSCPSPTPGVYSNSCPSSRWCHPAISSSVVPSSSCLQPLPASGSFPMSQLFAWCGQSIGVSASAWVLPMNVQDWSPLGWTGWISLQSKGLNVWQKPPQYCKVISLQLK